MSGHLKHSATTGHLLHNSSGHLVHDCNGAPGTCPGHPPLLDNYSISWNGTITVAKCPGCIWDNTPTSPITVNKPSGANCVWSYYAGVPHELELTGGKWVVTILCPSAISYDRVWTGEKTTGQTPVGNYTETSHCGTINLTNVQVT